MSTVGRLEEPGAEPAFEQMLFYARRDARIVDYQPYRLDRTNIWFRGPEPVLAEPGNYWVCLGAADAQGILCQRPYAALVESELRLPVVNLGYGGASPDFYRTKPQLVDLINQSRFVVIEAMPARGESNSMYEATGHLQRFTRRTDGVELRADEVWDEIRRNEPPEVQTRLLSDTRHSWVASHRRLIDALDVPTVFLYFSRRSPDVWTSTSTVEEMMKVFPQFVCRWMTEEIESISDDYVECVTERGSPAPLIDRHNGARITAFEASPGIVWKDNAYYPSPEMHIDAAAALIPACSRLVAS